MTTLHFVFVDSESLRQNKNDPAAQLAWLEATLAGPTSADWKIVIDHHPPYSAGNYGPTDATIVDQVLSPLPTWHYLFTASVYNYNCINIIISNYCMLVFKLAELNMLKMVSKYSKTCRKKHTKCSDFDIVRDILFRSVWMCDYHCFDFMNIARMSI